MVQQNKVSCEGDKTRFSDGTITVVAANDGLIITAWWNDSKDRKNYVDHLVTRVVNGEVSIHSALNENLIDGEHVNYIRETSRKSLKENVTQSVLNWIRGAKKKK